MYFTKSNLLKRTNERHLIVENANDIKSQNSFDIFLSHSYADKEYIVGLKDTLERDYGYTVYVDWITDGATLRRDNVSKDTAKLIKIRMKQSKKLIFATSSNSPNSKWMPWELGYFDGLKQGGIAILPITEKEDDTFYGQEYLALYPYIDIAKIQSTGNTTLWINYSPKEYKTIETWINE